MSTLSGIVSKGEKGKSKYQSLDINSLYRVSRGESLEQHQQKSTLPRKHGMQSLGKVPSARRPPANLPSLKSETSSGDPAVSLVPSGGSGWATTKDPASSTTNTATTTTPSNTTNSSSTQCITGTAPASTPTSSPGQLQGSSQTHSLETGNKSSWSAIMSQPGHTGGPGNQQSQQNREINAQYGPGPSLRPQTEGSWIQGGGRTASGTGGGAAGVGGGNIPGGQGPPMTGAGAEGASGGRPNLGQSPGMGSAQAGQNQGPNQQSAGSAAHQVGPNMHHYRGLIPQFMCRGNFPSGFPSQSGGPGGPGGPRPRVNYSTERFPPSQRRERERLAEEEIITRPIIKEEDLTRMDDISRDAGWTAQDEIDYNQKLAFSDEEETEESQLLAQSKEEKKDLKDEKNEKNAFPTRSLDDRDDRDNEQRDNKETGQQQPSVRWSQAQGPRDFRGPPGPNAGYPPHSQQQQQMRSSYPIKGVEDEEIWTQRRKEQGENIASAVVRARMRKEQEEKRYQETAKQAAAKKLQELNQKIMEKHRQKDDDLPSPAGANEERSAEGSSVISVPPVQIPVPGWERERESRERESRERSRTSSSEGKDDKASRDRSTGDFRGERPGFGDRRDRDRGEREQPGFYRSFQSNLPPRFQKQQQQAERAATGYSRLSPNAERTAPSQQPLSFTQQCDPSRWTHSNHSLPLSNTSKSSHQMAPSARRNRNDSDVTDDDRPLSRDHRCAPSRDAPSSKDDRYRHSMHRSSVYENRKSAGYYDDYRYKDYEYDDRHSNDSWERERDRERDRDRDRDRETHYDKERDPRDNRERDSRDIRDNRDREPRDNREMRDRDARDKKDYDSYSKSPAQQDLFDERESERRDPERRTELASDSRALKDERLERGERPQRPDSRDSRTSRDSRASLRDDDAAAVFHKPGSWANDFSDYEDKKREAFVERDRRQPPGPVTRDKLEADELKSEKRNNLTQLKRASADQEKKDPSKDSPVEPKKDEPWSRQKLDAERRNDKTESTSKAWADSSSPTFDKDEDKDIKDQDQDVNDLKRSIEKLNIDKREDSIDEAKDDKKEKRVFKRSNREGFAPSGEPSRRGRGGFRIRASGGGRMEGCGPPPSKSPFSTERESDEKSGPGAAAAGLTSTQSQENDSMPQTESVDDKIIAKQQALTAGITGRHTKLQSNASNKDSNHAGPHGASGGRSGMRKDDPRSKRSRSGRSRENRESRFRSSNVPKQNSSDVGNEDWETTSENSEEHPDNVKEPRNPRKQFSGRNQNISTSGGPGPGSRRDQSSRDMRDKNKSTSSSRAPGAEKRGSQGGSFGQRQGQGTQNAQAPGGRSRNQSGSVPLKNSNKENLVNRMDEIKLNDQNLVTDVMNKKNKDKRDDNESNNEDVNSNEDKVDADGFQEVRSKKNVKDKKDEPKPRKEKESRDRSKSKVSQAQQQGGAVAAQVTTQNIPPLLGQPVAQPSGMPTKQFERAANRQKLAPRFQKQRQAKLQQQAEDKGSAPAPPPSVNAWDKPFTSQLRSQSPGSQQTADSSQYGAQLMTEHAHESQEQAAGSAASSHRNSPNAATTADKSKCAPPKDGVVDSKNVNDASSPPVQTLIFENTNYSKTSKSGAEMQNKNKYSGHIKSQQRSDKRAPELDDESAVQMAPQQQQALSVAFSKPQQELIKDKTQEPIQMPLSFGKSEDNADMKLDFTFDTSDLSQLTEDKNKSLSMARSIHMAGAQSTISPSTAELNLKIASVKKVWENAPPMPTVVEHEDSGVVNSANSFPQAFESNDVEDTYGSHQQYSQNNIKNEISTSTNVCKEFPQYPGSQAAAAQYGSMSAIPSPPAVLYNTGSGQLPAQAGGLYGPFQLDQSRSPFTQYPPYGPSLQSSFNQQSMYLQQPPPHAPNAPAPDIYQSNISQYRITAATAPPFGQSQQMGNNPNTVLISSSSNSLMSGNVKPSSQSIGAIGTKAPHFQAPSAPQPNQLAYIPYDPNQVLGVSGSYMGNSQLVQRPGPTVQPSANSYYNATSAGFYQPGGAAQQTGTHYGLQGFSQHSQSLATGSGAPVNLQNFGSQFLSSSGLQIAAAAAQQYRNPTGGLPGPANAAANFLSKHQQQDQPRQLKSPSGNQQDIITSVFSSPSQIPSPKSRKQQTSSQQPQPSPTQHHKYQQYQGVNQSNLNVRGMGMPPRAGLQSSQQRYPPPIQRPVVPFPPGGPNPNAAQQQGNCMPTQQQQQMQINRHRSNIHQQQQQQRNMKMQQQYYSGQANVKMESNDKVDSHSEKIADTSATNQSGGAKSVVSQQDSDAKEEVSQQNE